MQNLSEFRSGADYDAQYGHSHKPQIKTLTTVAKELGGAVLDVCCGTGLVTIPIAEETGFVTHGVDVAEDMIAYARKKSEQTENIYFHHDNALTFHIPQSFNLAMMTGNAFQAFLSDEAILLLLKNVRRHLNTGGIFMFDTRLIEHFDTTTDDDFIFKHEYINASGKTVKYFGKKTHFDSETQILYSEMKRQYPDGHIVDSGIELKFTHLEKLLLMFAESGFDLVEKYADWNLRPFNPQETKAIFQLKKQ